MQRPTRYQYIGAFFALLFFFDWCYAATDERFFGAYCGNQNVQHCVTVRSCLFLGWPCVSQSNCESYELNDIRLNIEHNTIARDFGVIDGAGSARVDESEVRLRFGGVVVDHGEAMGSVISNFFSAKSGKIYLSTDGLTLRVHARGHILTTRKDACGNAPPSVTITSRHPQRIPFGQPIILEGQASDTEDQSSFPDNRLLWKSNIDGVLGKGLSVRKNILSTGTHRITFTVIDSGGLSASDVLTLSVINNPPTIPRIASPTTGQQFIVGSPIVFRGSSSDRENGNLTGESLIWSSDRDGELGSGIFLWQSLSEGEHIISLSARDSQGDTATADVSVSVVAMSGGNNPPSVALISPADGLYGMGDRSNDCMILVAQAIDPEEGILSNERLVWEDRYIDGRQNVIRREIGFGERLELCALRTNGHGTLHTISVRASDSEGLSATDQLRFLVIPGGLI